MRIFKRLARKHHAAIRALKKPTAATSWSNSGFSDVDRLLVTAGVPTSGLILA
jgi:hypothetical protein